MTILKVTGDYIQGVLKDYILVRNYIIFVGLPKSEDCIL